MQTANQWATRSTCPRLNAGAVVATPDGRILTTGYNGAPAGLPHCTDVGCLMDDSHCVRSVHAEMNAIIQAAKFGTRLDGSIIYVTHSSCRRCAMATINAGINHVVWGPSYRDAEEVHDLLNAAGVTVSTISGGRLVPWEG